MKILNVEKFSPEIRREMFETKCKMSMIEKNHFPLCRVHSKFVTVDSPLGQVCSLSSSCCYCFLKLDKQKLKEWNKLELLLVSFDFPSTVLPFCSTHRFPFKQRKNAQHVAFLSLSFPHQFLGHTVF